MAKFLRIIVFALLVVPYFAEAQSFYAIRRNRDLMVNVGSGVAYYQGDLVNPRQTGKIKPNIALGAEYFVLPRLSVRAGLTWFQLSGNDASANDDRVERNLSFRTNAVELNATGAINLIPNGLRFYQRARINLHAWAGVGALYFNPKAYYDGKWVALAPLETENKKYSRIQMVVPFGLGVRVRIDPFFNVLIEGGYRKTWTDHLDDVSRRRYVDPTLLKSDMSRALADRRRERDPEYPIHPNVGKRGNPDNNDGYFIGSIAVQYYIPRQVFSGQRKLYNAKRRAIYKRR